ncbi:MAG: hypothetical protein NT080_05345 [Spirochaetes bacterium]|nr:hypothetical protein [Spirochaetota bacterium]
MRFDFIQQATIEDVGIRGLSVVDDRIVWVSGTNGSFALTIDGGQTWQRTTIPGYATLDFRAIKAFSDSSAVVMSSGSPATILKTVDGGSTWKETYSDTAGVVFLDALGFWDETSGICLGDPLDGSCFLVETSDSGQTWSRIPASSLPEMIEGEAHFAASGTCVATFGADGLCFVSGGSAARGFISGDRGRTWKVSELPVMHGKPSQGAFSVAILDEDTACAVGGDYAQPGINTDTVVHTADGGLSWVLALTFPQAGYDSCVAYVPGTKGKYLVATGTQGTHVSNDGGRTWSVLHPESFNVIDFEKAGRCGWAAGSNGQISRILVT